VPTAPTYEYTAFFSYSRADDKRYGGYVRKFHEHFSQVLEGELNVKGQRFNPLFMDTLDLERVGELKALLKTNVVKSFGLFIFVGEGYLKSEWCLEELKAFSRHHGAAQDVLNERVWILDLQELNDELNVEFRKRLEEADATALYTQVRSALYDSYSKQRIQLTDPEGDLTSKGIAIMHGLAETFAKRYIAACRELPPPPPKPVVDVLFGLSTPDLTPICDELERVLHRRNRSVVRLPQADLSDLSDEELAERFTTARQIVLPVSAAKVLGRALPGGHVSRQLTATQGLAPERVLLWKRPAASAPVPDAEAEKDDRHRVWVDRALQPALPLSVEDAAAEIERRLVAGRPAGQEGLTVLIERMEPDNGEWELVGEEIDWLWATLSPEELRMQRPTVKGVYIRNLLRNAEPIDGHAVIVFMEPEQGQVEAKCEAVRKNIQRWKERASTIYPGLIASLEPPALDPPTIASFPFARFRQPADPAQSPPRFSLDDRSRQTLARCFRRMAKLASPSEPS
jgi:hypothetical protein